jgi:predicted nucleic acid-binding protein
MVTTGVSQIFIDTNILIYANVVTAPFHTQAQVALQNVWQSGADLWISRQVIREYAVTLTRPQVFSQPVNIATVITQIQYFQTVFRLADDTAPVTDRLLTLLSTLAVGGKQIHDANIVATMLVYGITHLMTHNVADFNRYAGLITVMPL